MADNSSLYGSTPPSGTVSSSNYTTLYSGGNNFVPSGDNVIISGTLTVNGCSILTDCSTFNLLPFNATTINFGGAATAMSVGGATGVTTIQNQLSTANYLFPLADGTANQVLITDGAGVLSFADVQSLDTNYNIQADTATGGANLTLVGSDATTDSVKFANGTNVTVSRTDASTITISSIDTNTTYTQNASATTGGANLNLVGSDATTDTIKFAQGAGITVVRTDADTITITNTDPGSAGVTSITGTANQVIASSPTGAVTLSLPQDIATTSNPVFAGITGGNVTVGIADNQTISTTTGALYLNSALTSGAQIYIGNNADELQTGFSSPSNSLLFTDNFINGNLASRKYNVNNNAVAYPLRMEAVAGTAVTPGAGYGVGMYAGMTNASGTFLTAANIDVSWTDATAATEDSKFAVSLLRNGAMTLASSLDSNGNLELAGGITVSGSTSGSSTFNAPATGSNLIYTLPGTAGASSTVLTNDGAGNLSWALPGGGGSTFGNITIAVVDDNTISTTTGDLILDANSNLVKVDATTFNVNSDNLFVNNNRVGINNNAPDYELHLDQGQDSLTQFGMTNNERTFIISNNGADDLLSLYYGVIPPAGDNRLQFNLTDQWFNTGKLGVNNATPAYELDVYGTGRFTSDLIATNSIKIDGITSGYTAITQPAIAANIQYILPNAQGAVSTVLTNDGSGNLSWALPGGGGSTFGNITIAVDTDNTISTTTGDLILQTEAGVDSGVITIEAGADNDVVIEPNGLGRVLLTTDQVVVGDLNASAAITTNGTGNLYFNTNGFTNSGQMFLEAGVNGNIVLAPYTPGTGAVKTYNNFVVNDSTFFVDSANGRVGVNTATPGQEFTISDGGDGYVQFGMINTERLWLVTNNAGDNLISYTVQETAGSPVNRLQFDATGGDQWFPSGNLGVGTATPAYALDVSGTGRFTSNLIATGGITLNGTTSGYSDIIQPAVGANIQYVLPAAQGAVSTVLTNDGSGNLSWALPGGGGSTFGNITVGVVTDNTISTTTGDLVLASFTNLLDAATLSANFNNVSVDNQADLDSSTLTTTATATVALNTTTRNAMTGLINIIQGANVHCLNFTILRVDATTALLTTYAEMYNTTSLASFTGDVSGGLLRLLVTPTSATSTVFSVVRTSLT